MTTDFDLTFRCIDLKLQLKRICLYLIIIQQMNQVPSQSISKSILLVTPLFLIVLAVLHSSSELSYLFILKFINNVAGSADITFLPTTQPQISHQQFAKQNLMQQFGLNYSPNRTGTDLKFPLIDIKSLQNWASKQSVIKGISPRWLIPTKVGIIDTILIVVDIQKQKQIDLIGKDVVPALDEKQIAMEELLSHKLGYQIGDVVPINFKPKNLPNGLKLFDKFQSDSSDQQYKIDEADVSQQQFADMLINFLDQYGDGQIDIDKEQVKKIFKILYESQVNVQYTLKKTYYPEGIYPSAISNVILIERQGFYAMISNWIAKAITQVNEEIVDVQKLLPPEYQSFWPKSQFQAQAASILSKSQMKLFFQNYSMMSVCRLQSREQIYSPKKSSLYTKFTQTLQQTPTNTQVIVIYPFFQQSLAIKYFFDSVIQIFEFVTCIIYFYTMTLIMKQIYQEKQIQVGIWRTLGAGAVVKKSQAEVNREADIQIQMGELRGNKKKIRYRSQFQEDMSIKQKLGFYGELLVKVGYIYYWLATTAASIALYFLLKLIFYYAICTRLGFGTISQPYSNLPIIFSLIMLFILALLYEHIFRIYTNPLSETIKPVKRTFDVVKVRIIHVATFGLSMEMLLIAVMLVYYGVVSYYWIPFAVLDGQADLQVLLFNTIFLFMIFGSIILLSILQSRIEIGIFKVIFMLNGSMRRMSSAILKNIKAKQYKNIKVGVIISIIFAFVLFFTAGIKIQMQIVQSFIQRALGSSLVFENYEKKTFNNTAVQQILDSRQGIQYSWLSKQLKQNISISLVSHITGKKIYLDIQVLTPSYLNSTFSEYYYPQHYMPESKDYWKLPNSNRDGFNSIYQGEGGKQSVGKYNPADTLTDIDPYYIRHLGVNDSGFTGSLPTKTAPEEQVIRLVVSTSLRKQLGVDVGDYYKMRIINRWTGTNYFLRSQITHSFKAGPGFDILGKKAFLSEQQAAYIYQVLGMTQQKSKQHEKLFIKGSKQQLKGIGSAIIPISPQHTQMFEIEFVSKSFSLLSTYLNAYIVLITGIMSTLVTIFIFLYTISKCREEAEMYKMLRAIGLSSKSIRVMVFSQIIIRLAVAIVGGILLGVVFSLGFSLQIQEFLMINTPPMDVTIVCLIGLFLIIIFSITIIKATKYISERSVAQTTKI